MEADRGGPVVEIIDLDTALTKLAAESKEIARVVDLRFFGGLSLNTTALPNNWTVNTAQAYTHTVTDTVRIFNPTNVVLASRDVTVEDGVVVLSWSTVDENDIVGFHVLRLDEVGGEPVRLTSDTDIILAQGFVYVGPKADVTQAVLERLTKDGG